MVAIIDILFFKGVYSSTECSNGINHGILVVGYNKSSNGYWIVKNSRGTGWVMAGKFKIS